MKYFKLSLIFTLALTGCATTRMPQTSPRVPVTGPTVMLTLPPPTTTASHIEKIPDLTSAEQVCRILQSQFKTQLPFQILNLMKWHVTVTEDPLQPTGPVPACMITLHTNGEIIQREGLTTDFISTTLERLDWMPGPISYAADSAVGHQEAMIYANQLAIINYYFSPPFGVCPKNQPIAACKFPRKKWRYDLNMWVFSNNNAAVPLQIS